MQNPIHVAINVDQGKEFIAFRVPRVSNYAMR